LYWELYEQSCCRRSTPRAIKLQTSAIA
jgi:hypothetical protein